MILFSVQFISPSIPSIWNSSDSTQWAQIRRYRHHNVDSIPTCVKRFNHLDQPIILRLTTEPHTTELEFSTTCLWLLVGNLYFHENCSFSQVR